MGKRKQKMVDSPAALPERSDNSLLGDALGAGGGVGIGGGINPIGFPGQGGPFSAQVSQPTTIFENLRWYLVSNFRQVLSEAYVELGLIQTICDVPVDDALRGGIELKSKQLNEEQIDELLTSLDRDDDLNVAGQAAKWNRLFGGAGIIIITDQDPEEPLVLEDIGPDSLLEFRAVDMWELFGDNQNEQGYNPAVQSGSTDYYMYYSERIHKSRVMRLKGFTAPSFIRPRLRGWGFSVVEVLVRSINQYLKATDLGFEVLDEFKLDVYKIKNLVNTLLSPNGQQKVRERIQLANWQKNYQNAIVMDAEDDFDHKQLSFAGLGDAMAGIRMQVASDLRMPLTKLFGISATGFNSGEDDLEVYNSMVESQVRGKIKYDILRISEIKCQKLFGFVPDDLSLAFKPLRVLSAEGEEKVKDSRFTRALQSQQAGLITAEEFRDECNRSKLFSITLEDDALGEIEDLQDAAAEEAQGGEGEPGTNKQDSSKTKAGSDKSTPKDPPAAKDKTKNSGWDESKHPRADDGKFGEGGGSADKKEPAKAPPAESLPDVDGKVDGREVMEGGVPNEESIGSTLDDYEILPGIREISMDFFTYTPPYSSSEMKRTKDLAARIKDSGQIAPLIIVEDAEGFYVLEGGHRFDALNMLGAKSFPALVVKDLSNPPVKNSAAYDKAAYLAEGGDGMYDPRRKELMSNPGKVDEALWAKAKEASKAALGEIRWQFVTWAYKRMGGKFN